jgi:hypothetical protein
VKIKMNEDQNKLKNNTQWSPLLQSDLDFISKAEKLAHPTLPERLEIFQEIIQLCPSACLKFTLMNDTMGYGVAHLWMLHSIPPLNEFLYNIPNRPDCLFIHDVVVLPEARGNKAAALYIKYIKKLATELNISTLALVSVYGTDVLWSRFGFQVVQEYNLNYKLLSYGPSAKYMICPLR